MPRCPRTLVRFQLDPGDTDPLRKKAVANTLGQSPMRGLSRAVSRCGPSVGGFWGGKV